MSERRETPAQRRRNEKYRTVVELREQGLTIREIAAEVSVSVGTVHRWLRIYDKASHYECERMAIEWGEAREPRPYSPPPVKSVNRKRRWARERAAQGEGDL